MRRSPRSRAPLADRPSYKYRDDVLAECRRYGVFPTEQTPPALARGFINELYKFELRKLRERYIRREFPKADYHRLVIEIRDKYPVLALPPRLWISNPEP
jgi:hypothetical protein